MAGLLLFSLTAANIAAYGNHSELHHADAAIVLGAGTWGDKPSPTFAERINHSIDLYTQGYVDRLIFSGGQVRGQPFTEAEVARQYALDRGIPAEAILIEAQSHTTLQNLDFTRAIAVQHNLTTFLIVSDPYHMKRSMLIAHDLGLDASPSPTPTSRIRSWNEKLKFLIRETCFYWLYLAQRLFMSRVDLSPPENKMGIYPTLPAQSYWLRYGL